MSEITMRISLDELATIVDSLHVASTDAKDRSLRIEAIQLFNKLWKTYENSL